MNQLRESLRLLAMVHEREILHDSQRYVWSYDPAVRLMPDCFTWRESDTYTVPHLALQHRLNRKLIEEHAAAVVAEVEPSLHEHLLRMLQQHMGATIEELHQCGLGGIWARTHPEEARERKFADLPPSAHSLLNCPVLRDWCFHSTPEVAIPRIVRCLGEGPFEAEEFARFLASQGLSIEDAQEPPVAAVHKTTTIVILGRDGWTEDEIDALIDEHVGLPLRIYSQEMWVTFMATKRDPFLGGVDVLAAFQAGHEGLELLSEGWTGWVEAFVPFDESARRHNRPNRIGAFAFAVPDGPLSVMGYHVGANGVELERRREILNAAFKRDLPICGPAEYMRQWGEPDTPARLRKIAESIAAFCRSQWCRKPPSYQSIIDYVLDLEWLKDNHYHGHFNFHWPDPRF